MPWKFNPFTGTLDRSGSSSGGGSGTDGREIELQNDGVDIQWRYVGDPTWNDLVALIDIKGDPGTDGGNGLDGSNGTNGREVELQKSSTYVQWRYVGDASWINLIPLSDITGPTGATGAPGSAGATGPKGDTGNKGADAAWIHPANGFRMIEPWQGASFNGALAWQGSVNSGGIALNNTNFTTSAGAVALTTNASATSAPFLSLDGTSATFMVGSFIPYSFENRTKLGNLSTISDEFIVRNGFLQSLTNSTPPPYGVWFEYDRTQSGDFWRLVSNDNGSVTTLVTTTPVTTNFVRLKIWINAAGTSAKFYIDGVKVGEITTNIPKNNTSKALNPGFILAKTAGTTNRAYYLDWAIIEGGDAAYDPDINPLGLGSTPNTWLSGSGAPSSSLGITGDFYLDLTGLMFYGPKTSGSWGTGSSMTGGAKGDKGDTGAGVPIGGSVDQVLSKNSSIDFDTSWINIRTLEGLWLPWFGSGESGTVTNFAGGAVASDRMYAALSVATTGNVRMQGFRLFCRGVLTVLAGGIISADGNAGSAGGATGAAGAAGVNIPQNEVGGTAGGGVATAGGAGVSNALGVIATNPVQNAGLGGSSGKGGDGGSGNGGAFAAVAGRAAVAIIQRINAFFSPVMFMTSPSVQKGGGQSAPGGSSGGGAVAGAGAGGGGGGTGGGIVMIFCHTLNNLGTIRALGGDGGAGGDASNANCGGGGGGAGGGGGFVYIICFRIVSLGTISVNGGVGGRAGVANGTGTNGTAGTNGTVGSARIYEISTDTWTVI